MERYDFEKEFERIRNYHKFGFVWIEINGTDLIRVDKYTFSSPDDGFVWLYFNQNKIALINFNHIVGVTPCYEDEDTEVKDGQKKD
jgi:hypothetical protein